MIALIVCFAFVVMALYGRRHFNIKIQDYSKEETLYGLVVAYYWLVVKCVHHPVVNGKLSKLTQGLTLLKPNQDPDHASGVFMAKIATTLHLACLFVLGLYGLGVSMTQDMIILFGLGLLLLVVLPFYDLSKQQKIKLQTISNALPQLLYQLAILMNAGATLEMAMAISFESISSGHPLYLMRLSLEKSRASGESIQDSLAKVTNLMPLITLFKFNNLVVMSATTGAHQLSDGLITLADQVMLEKKYQTRMAAERLSTKLLMPMMLSLIGIMVMMIYPILSQL